MRIVIEADSIATDRMSGIGHATLEIIRALSLQKNTNDQIVVVVPFGTKSKLEKYNLIDVKVRTLLPGYRYVNRLLVRTSLPIPVDVFFGRGVYIFPNYKNWYVPFSQSITFVHDVAYKIFPETIHPKNLLYLNANMTRWMKRAQVLATISQASADEITELFPEYKEKVQLVPLGVDTNMFYERSVDEITLVCKKIGIDGDYFIYVGNIEPRKNIMVLLEAYQLYADSVQTASKLVLIGGDGWKNDTINEHIEVLRAAGYGIVRPNTYVEDDLLPALYSGAKALVHVSLHEGFGLSVVQAQACGTPVIVSDIPVLREVASSIGRYLVNSQDSSSIAAAMKQADAKQYVAKAHPGYTWKETAKKIISLTDIVGDDNAR